MLYMYYSYAFIKSRLLLSPKLQNVFSLKRKGSCTIKYVSQWFLVLKNGFIEWEYSYYWNYYIWSFLVEKTWLISIMYYICLYFVQTHFLQLGILYVFTTEKIPMGSTYDFYKCKACRQSMKLYKADR